MGTTWLISLPFIAHLALAGIVIYKIKRSVLLTKRQKQLNVVLTVLIPFAWAVLMHYILKKEPNYFDKRKQITNGKLEEGIISTSDFHAGTYHH